MESAELSEEVPLRGQFTVDDLDIEILPLIYEIIRSVEKDPHDTTQKAKESQDTSHKILELQKKLDSARAQIKRLPGIEYSKEEQLQKLETLRKQLRLKRELLLKKPRINMRFFRSLFLYFMNNERLINKLAESKPIRKAAQFVVYMLCKTGTLHGTSRITNPQEFGQLLKKIAQTFKEDLKRVKDDIKKNSPK